MRAFPTQSIKLRLPALIVGLLGAMVAGLGWSAHHQLTLVSNRLVDERLRASSGRLTEMLAQSVVTVTSEVRRAGADPALVEAIAHPTDASREAARRALSESIPPQMTARILWSRQCAVVVRIGAPLRRRSAGCPRDVRNPAPPAHAGAPWLTPLLAAGDSVRYDVVLPLLDAKGDTTGFLTETRTLTAGQTGRALGALIGKDVVVMLGNAGRPALWTDLTRPVAPPLIGATRDRQTEYTDESGARQVGVARDVPSTPWVLWVQLPRAEISAPASAMMRDLALIAAGCLLLGIAGAWAISRHVTRPLVAVAEAADAIARGDYTRRVPDGRRDEIGQLAASFNHMATQVALATQKLEAQAREVTAAESLLDEVLMQAPMGIAVLDRELRYLRLNQAIADFHGVSVSEHLGKRPGDVVPELRELAEPILERVLLTGEKIVDERVQGALLGRGKRHFLSSCFPIRGAASELVGVGAIVIETTAQQELEQQLLQAQKMEAVGRLAGGVAHDFNNLLTVITSYSTMALESLHAEDPLHQDIAEIRGAAERATRLTGQLLAFSRRQVLRPQLLDLSKMATEMERMLRRLIGEDITLTLRLAANLGSISADPGQIEQVMMNLVVNARDAMPDGGRIVIETANRVFSGELSMTEMGRPAGEYVVLSVTDTGVGMSDETLGNLFEPFFTTKEPGVGTGLGLSTVYGIVKQSGGDIHVQSELGRGTTFRLYFPRVYESAQRHGRRTPVRDLAPGGSETILLVEDDESLRQLAARVLREVGYVVLDARSPADALRIGAHHPGEIDLLLTDVVMPQMSGRTVAELVTKMRPAVAVLYMSGYTDDDVLRRGVLATDSEFLQKPFTPEQLLQQVRVALDNRGEARVA